VRFVFSRSIFPPQQFLAQDCAAVLDFLLPTISCSQEHTRPVSRWQVEASGQHFVVSFGSASTPSIWSRFRLQISLLLLRFAVARTRRAQSPGFSPFQSHAALVSQFRLAI
jgi:hypothetical protein